ncbi:restriction endonuclease PLD domain-containing protein [Microbacterium rhizosphaerae]|uniref:NgoFVII family restriction endonuclease n=1 Tax=Microbacterium rhizosphaerae TaxID=1678237 RepID=A0ABZ0SM25_9MICO|nr:restriction endonuclease PLD domain-containing protein [Microbacterium rhizosphaerae]WPR88742.1 NgoFVII family restriction endonuclease [Microbacterium rhizosphaerae]
MAALVRDDLLQRVLLSPTGDGCDELHVLTGYASAQFALFHILELREQLGRDVAVRLNIGMTGEEGLELSAHQGFLGAISALSGDWLRVSYAPHGVSDHTKLYVWNWSGLPTIAWFGSANYTAHGFGLSGTRRESMIRVEPESAWSTMESATAGFISATDESLFSRVHVYEADAPEQRRQVLAPTRLARPPLGTLDSVDLPLVQTTKRPGEVHNAGAGLNWGQRGSRRRSEAYIPVPAAVARSGFFPPRGLPFAAHTDDGATLFLIVAQDGDKALHSVPDNGAIGRWFRRRLGLADTAFVQTEDLERYGSTHVTFSALADGSYFMDFEPH